MDEEDLYNYRIRPVPRKRAQQDLRADTFPTKPFRCILLGVTGTGKSMAMGHMMRDGSSDNFLYPDMDKISYYSTGSAPENYCDCPVLSYNSLPSLPYSMKSGYVPKEELILMDDIPLENKRLMTEVVKPYFTRGRHHLKSVVASFHNISDVPQEISKMANMWIITKGASKTNERMLRNRMGLGDQIHLNPCARYIICSLPPDKPPQIYHFYDNEEDVDYPVYGSTEYEQCAPAA